MTNRRLTIKDKLPDVRGFSPFKAFCVVLPVDVSIVVTVVLSSLIFLLLLLLLLLLLCCVVVIALCCKTFDHQFPELSRQLPANTTDRGHKPANAQKQDLIFTTFP